MSLLAQKLSNPADRKAIYDAIREISNSMTRMEAEKDLISETLKAVKDKFELPPKYVRTLAKIYHKQNFNQIKEEQAEVEELYESITS
jgi:DNA-binding transcriptional regulator GbsR (MarR family)